MSGNAGSSRDKELMIDLCRKHSVNPAVVGGCNVFSVNSALRL